MCTGAAWGEFESLENLSTGIRAWTFIQYLSKNRNSKHSMSWVTSLHIWMIQWWNTSPRGVVSPRMTPPSCTVHKSLVNDSENDAFHSSAVFLHHQDFLKWGGTEAVLVSRGASFTLTSTWLTWNVIGFVHVFCDGEKKAFSSRHLF